MNIEEFPACCGIDVLTGLFKPEDTTYGLLEDGISYGYRLWTKQDQIDTIRDCLLDTKLAKRGLVLAVTNQKAGQVANAKLLQKFGFKKLRQFYNPRHRSTLTMWIYEIGKITKAQIKAKAKQLCKEE